MILDTVIWETTSDSQTGKLKPEYKKILTEFSNRFVVATDYGGGRSPWPDFLRKKVENLRLILGNLPKEAQHNIAYRNAWTLLSGKKWDGGPKGDRTEIPASSTPIVLYEGPIMDGHGHLDGDDGDPETLIAAMDANGVEVILVMPKHTKGWTDDDSLSFAKRHPGRVVPAIGFQAKGWQKSKNEFMKAVIKNARSGRWSWLGEISFRGKIGGKLHASPETPRWPVLLDISAETAMPLTVHHNPWEQAAGGWRRTNEFEAFVDTLSHNAKASIVWAHWCGLNNPDEVRKLLKRFSNLYCDLAWITKNQATLPNPLLVAGGVFTEDWKRLMEEYSNRFVLGIDVGGRPRQMEKYSDNMKLIRGALGGLSEKTAIKLAGENFLRLAGLK